MLSMTRRVLCSTLASLARYFFSLLPSFNREVKQPCELCIGMPISDIAFRLKPDRYFCPNHILLIPANCLLAVLVCPSWKPFTIVSFPVYKVAMSIATHVNDWPEDVGFAETWAVADATKDNLTEAWRAQIQAVGKALEPQQLQYRTMHMNHCTVMIMLCSRG